MDLAILYTGRVQNTSAPDGALGGPEVTYNQMGIKVLCILAFSGGSGVGFRRGQSLVEISKRLSIRLLAVPLILAVFCLGTLVVSHFDANSHDEAHCTCQVCHVAHAAIPQPAAQTQVQIPLHVMIFAVFEQSPSTAESANAPSIPRAPPA